MNRDIQKNNRKLKAAMSYYIKHDDPTRLKNIKKLIDERNELFKKYQENIQGENNG